MTAIRFGEQPGYGRQDITLLRGPSGRVTGAWVRNSADAHNQIFMVAAFLKAGLSTGEIAGQHRIVPNEATDEGGCFVMLGSFPAPGENKPTKKKWWEFWK